MQANMDRVQAYLKADFNFHRRIGEASHNAIISQFVSNLVDMLEEVLRETHSDSLPATGGFVSLWPIEFTFENYEQVLGSRKFLRSFLISVIRVLTGTSLNMI